MEWNEDDLHDFSNRIRIIGFLSFGDPMDMLYQNYVTSFEPTETFVWLYKYQMKFYLQNN